MSKESACVGTTREEQKQLMVSAVEALSSPPPAPQVATNNESSDGPFKLQPNTSTPKTTAIRSTPNFSKKATASRVDSRLPAVKSTSVFDRLYKSHTVASKSHNLTTRAKMRPSTRAKLPSRGTSARKSASEIEKDLLVFSSMSISKSNRMSTPHKINWAPKATKSSSSFSFATPQPRKKRPSSSSYQAPYTAPTKSSSSAAGSSSMSTPIITPRSSKRVYEFSPRMKPITKLYYVSKFHPGLGLEPVEPISLGYTFFQTFCEYETGGIDSETIAKEIFLAFFRKDFPSIRHWKLHEPTLAKINSKKSNDDSPGGRGGGGGITAYAIKMNATYSWRDTYRFANARGVVRIKGIQKEIRVENFTYDLTGDP